MNIIPQHFQFVDSFNENFGSKNLSYAHESNLVLLICDLNHVHFSLRKQDMKNEKYMKS